MAIDGFYAAPVTPGSSGSGFYAPSEQSTKQYYESKNIIDTQAKAAAANAPTKFGKLVNAFTDPSKNPGLGLINDAVGTVKKAANALGSIPVVGSIDKGILDTASSTFKNMWSVYEQYPSKIWDDIQSAGKDFQNVGDTSGVDVGFNGTQKKTLSGNIINASGKAAIRTAGDTANALFAPLSAALGSILEASGGQKLTDHTGQVVADSSGITDLPAFQQFAMQHPNFSEDFNRILNVVMSAGETEPIKPKRMVSDVFGLAKKTIEQAQPPEGTPSTPAEVKLHQAEEAKAKAAVEAAQTGEQPVVRRGTKSASPENNAPAEPGGYDTPQGNQYTPDSQLPEIQMGSKPKPSSDLPTIDFNAPADKPVDNRNPSFKYEPLRSDGSDPSAPAPAQPKAIDGFTSAPAETTTPVDKSHVPVDYSNVTNSDGQPVSKLATDIATKIGLQFGDLEGYTKMNMVEQAQRALKFIGDNFQAALDVAMGRVPAPDGIREGSIFTALKEKALADGDVETLTQLTKTKIGVEAAQRLKAFDDGKRAIADPVNAIRDVQTAREKSLEGRTGKKASDLKTQEVEKIKGELKKTAPTKQTWEDFINTIKCGY